MRPRSRAASCSCRGRTVSRTATGPSILDGEQQQLALTEPSRHNAIHGLLGMGAYDLVVERGATP